MKAMYKSLSNAVCRTLDTGAATMESAEKAIGDVNYYVEVNSKANRMSMLTNAKERAATNHMRIQDKLNEDEKFANAFAAIEAEW